MDTTEKIFVTVKWGSFFDTAGGSIDKEIDHYKVLVVDEHGRHIAGTSTSLRVPVCKSCKQDCCQEDMYTLSYEGDMPSAPGGGSVHFMVVPCKMTTGNLGAVAVEVCLPQGLLSQSLVNVEVGQFTQIDAEASFTVDACYSAEEESKVRAATNHALADATDGVTADQIQIKSIACTSTRRLRQDTHARRLAGTIDLGYSMIIPDAGTVPTQASTETDAFKTALKNNINTRLTQYGVQVVVSAAEVKSFTTTVKGVPQPTSSTHHTCPHGVLVALLAVALAMAQRDCR